MNESRKVNLGDVAKDSVTGFEGIVVAYCEWLHGCARVTLQPQKLKDGIPIEAQTFDELQLERVTPKAIASATPSERQMGGPRDDRKAMQKP